MSLSALLTDIVDFPVLTVLYRLIGLALLAAFVAGAVSFFFRWRTQSQLPEGPALLLGLGAVTLYLNTNIVLIQFLGADGEVLTSNAIAANLLIFAASTITAAAGWQVGDRFGKSERFRSSFNPSLSPLVRATGRTLTVELPDTIEDIAGYEPVANAQKDALAGQSYSFPRRMTVEALAKEVETRIRTDYDVAHVDIEVTVDGEINYLAVGGQATGIGPTLPPGTIATAIRADPAFSASPGDTVQLWNEEKRVGTAELRATAGETVTVAGRESLITKLDPERNYRLMTLPAEERVDRLFAGMLRRSVETMSVVTVQDESTLHGMTIGALGLPVVAVTNADGQTTSIPQRERVIAAGDKLSVLGHPTTLRRVETAAAEESGYEPPTVDEPRVKKRRRDRFKRVR